MAQNTVFQKSLRGLAHPVILAALALVGLNDIFLKPLHPSWLTGKLSDVGALAAAPLLLALALSLIFPRRERLVGLLSLGIVALFFVLLKIAPASNGWLLAAARAAGLPLRAVADPSDLLALPALALPAWLWFGRLAKQPSGSPTGLTRLGQAGLVLLSALVLLGDAAAQDRGINCLAIKNGVLFSESSYFNQYTSQNGGLAWVALETSIPDELCPEKDSNFSQILGGPNGSQYRVSGGKGIEKLVEGSNWQSVYQPPVLSQAQEFYFDIIYPQSFHSNPGPLDAVVDPSSGNLVVAMGLEGVLVIPPGSQPDWIDVGLYHHTDLRADGFNGILSLLFMVIVLAIPGSVLWLVTVTLHRRVTILNVILVVFGWIFFTLTMLMIYPPNTKGYGPTFIAYLSIGTFLLTLISLITVLIRQGKPGIKRFLWIALCSPFAGLIFLIPYFAWAYSIIADYWVATEIASALLLLLIGLGLWRIPKL